MSTSRAAAFIPPTASPQAPAHRPNMTFWGSLLHAPPSFLAFILFMALFTKSSLHSIPEVGATWSNHESDSEINRMGETWLTIASDIAFNNASLKQASISPSVLVVMAMHTFQAHTLFAFAVLKLSLGRSCLFCGHESGIPDQNQSMDLPTPPRYRHACGAAKTPANSIC